MLEPLSTVHGLSFGWHVACRDFRKDHQTKARCWELGQLGDGGVMLPLSFCGLGEEEMEDYIIAYRQVVINLDLWMYLSV